MRDIVEEVRKPWVENDFMEDLYIKYQPYVKDIVVKENGLMGKKLYVIEDDCVKEKNIVYENDNNYYYVMKDKYFKEEEVVTSISKNRVVYDSGSFKDVYLGFGISGVFSTRELAEEYLKAYNKYKTIWQKQYDLEHAKGAVKYNKAKIEEYEDELKELDKNVW